MKESLAVRSNALGGCQTLYTVADQQPIEWDRVEALADRQQQLHGDAGRVRVIRCFGQFGHIGLCAPLKAVLVRGRKLTPSEIRKYG